MHRLVVSALLLLAAGRVSAEAAPLAIIKIESAKYCLGSELPPGFELKPRERRIHPVTPATITLKLSVRIEYRNPRPTPVLLVPVEYVNEFTGRSANHLIGIGSRKPESAGTVDIDSTSRQTRGIPPLEIPIEHVIPPGGDLHFPFAEEVSAQVYSPGKPKESLLGQKLWFQLEMIPYRLSPKAAREFAKRKDQIGIPWTDAIRTNILDFDIPVTPMTESCVHSFRID